MQTILNSQFFPEKTQLPKAKIGLRHDPLIKAIADETLRKLHDFSAQGLVNTLWGFATLVIKGEELFVKKTCRR